MKGRQGKRESKGNTGKGKEQTDMETGAGGHTGGEDTRQWRLKREMMVMVVEEEVVGGGGGVRADKTAAKQSLSSVLVKFHVLSRSFVTQFLVVAWHGGLSAFPPPSGARTRQNNTFPLILSMLTPSATSTPLITFCMWVPISSVSPSGGRTRQNKTFLTLSL